MLLVLLASCSGAEGVDPAQDGETAAAEIRWLTPAEEIPGIDQRQVGQGAEGAVILSAQGRSPGPAVVYLHGWSPLPPSAEKSAISTLVKAGYTVIYPAYQEVGSKVEEYLPNAVAGIRSALAELGTPSNGLVTIGHSTGGALAFDLVAVAGEHGLPAPAAAVAISPGRNPDGEMPRPDYGAIPTQTRLMAAVVPGSRIPGATQEARRMLRLASSVPAQGKRLYISPNIEVLDGKSQAQINRIFWRPILRLLADVRNGEKTTLDRDDSYSLRSDSAKSLGERNHLEGE